MIAIGLMSGTSADAIDAAVVRLWRTQDTLYLESLAYIEQPHPPSTRRRILNLFPPHRGSARAICEVNVLIGEAFAKTALATIEAAGLVPSQIDLIASHGQTIYHQVEPGHTRSTLQIGEPAVIAERTGITTVADFRPRDIAAGGQGAPLVSYIDHLCFYQPNLTRVIQNIGGIGNATVLGQETFAFDTGPGNALIDHAASRLSGGKREYDRDGAWAARGTIHQGLLTDLLDHPYFAQQPPKTTGRELFGAAFADRVIDRAQEMGLSQFDIMATLTALTAHSIARAYTDFVPTPVDQVILSGGGQRNATLLQMIKQELSPTVNLRPADAFGISSDGKEALSFAVLGYLTLHGWTGTLSACTGADHPSVLGHITPGKNYRQLLDQIVQEQALPPQHLSIQNT